MTDDVLERQRAKWRDWYYRSRARDPEGAKERQRAAHARRLAAETAEQREARLAYGRAYYAEHREQQRAYMKAKSEAGYFRDWNRKKRAEDPAAWRRMQQGIRLKSKYGLSIETYDAMNAAQGGLCAICQRPETLVIKGTVCTLAVDHDATTGRIRGLLCVNCNMAIGGLKHDPALFRAAIAYLAT